MPQIQKYASHAARQAAYRKRQDKARKAEREAKGLPALPKIASMPGWARWNASLALALELLEQTAWEMRDYFDERTECWQEGDRGQEHEERIRTVDAAVSALNEASW